MLMGLQYFDYQKQNETRLASQPVFDLHTFGEQHFAIFLGS